ncbi:MAG TPA: MarR family transcriptional regulator [Pseudonocardiaceae bacterium]|jgi:DNA-binding MarR family transcriptional regulator|nr:MarR family transcriptional regulator [Pseudonocardiaceae bacterium]
MRNSHVENAAHQVNDDTDACQPDRLAAAADLGSQCTRFLRLVRKVGASLTFQRNDGIESAAYAVLACAVVAGPQRLTALAEMVHADPSTVSRQTSALVHHGLLERRADPADGRASLLVATPEGRKVFEDNKRLRSRILAKALGDWSITDLAALTVLLERLNTDLERGVDRFFAKHGAAESRAQGQPR